MLIGKVTGTVVSTVKDEKVTGLKFQIVETMNAKGELTGGYVVAADSVGAGIGEVVLYATGSSARQTEFTLNKPVDAVIMAIIDSFETGGKTVYKKNE